MADEGSDLQDLEAQMAAAVAAIRTACLDCLHETKAYPHIIVMAAATVTGELGAAATMASGDDLTALLNELGDIVRRAGKDQWARLRTGAGH
jgi:hypothetical protein